MKYIAGTLQFEHALGVRAYAAVVGQKEYEGPLGKEFDKVIFDPYAGKSTFEQAESTMLSDAVETAMNKAGLKADDIDAAFSGDLLNQCVASSFAMRGFSIPYVGLYGACSTMALGLIAAAIGIESGGIRRAVCSASSHFCTAERQYRTPLEYGAQRPPTAQWTVTGAGACLISDDSENKVRIRSAHIGTIVDMGVTDQSNMGAAMAPANVKLGTKDFAVFRYIFLIRASTMDKFGNFMYDDIRNR